MAVRTWGLRGQFHECGDLPIAGQRAALETKFALSSLPPSDLFVRQYSNSQLAAFAQSKVFGSANSAIPSSKLTTDLG